MFSINREEPYDILAVGDWSQKLSFYQLSGKQVLVNPLTPKISLAFAIQFLWSKCGEFVIRSTYNPINGIFLYSHHFSA